MYQVPMLSASRENMLAMIGRSVSARELYALYTAQTEYRKYETNIFPEMKLCGLSPSSYIYVFVGDLYIPTMGRLILLQENRWTDPGYI